MGTERWSRLRPDRRDALRETLPIPRDPSMDSREEHLAATRIDIRTPPMRPGGRTRSAVPAPGATSVRRGILGSACGWHMAPGVLEARSTAHRGFLRQHARGLPRTVVSVATERAPKSFRDELRGKR